jgi:hypothetical protein
MDDAGALHSFAVPSNEPRLDEDVLYPIMRDLCSNGETVIAVDGAGGRVLFGIDDGTAARVPNGTLSCEGVNGDFYIRTDEGWARLTAEGTEETPLDPEATTLVGTGEEVFAVRVDGAESGLIINGQPVRTMRDDGTALRPLQVAAAYGNLGGVTRDGALVVLDEERRLYLLPWAELATAMDLPTGLPSRRPVREIEEVTGPALPDIEVETPRLRPIEQRRDQAPLPEPPQDGGR